MVRKLLLIVLVVAATAFGLWRLGLLREDRLKDRAAELEDRAADGARRAAGEAVEKGRGALDDARRR